MIGRNSQRIEKRAIISSVPPAADADDVKPHDVKPQSAVTSQGVKSQGTDSQSIDVQAKTEIHELIQNWISQDSRRNLKMLSRRTRIPYTSLRRMLTKTHSLSLDQCLSLLTFVADKQATLEFIERYFPETHELLLSGLSENLKSGFSDDKLSQYGNDPVSCEILELAYSGNGLNLDQLRKEYGGNGLQKAKLLESDGLLAFEKKSNCYIGVKGIDLLTCTLSPSIARSISMLQNFDKTQRAVLYYLTNKVSDEAVLELKDVLRTMQQRVYQIISDRSKRGPNPIGVVLSCGLFSNILEED